MMVGEEKEREEELGSLLAIFPELNIDSDDPYSATLELAITPSEPLLIRFVPDNSIQDGTHVHTTGLATACVERDLTLSHLPPVTLKLNLPEGYPATSPPSISLCTNSDWLPQEKVQQLELHVSSLWEEYGRCQILYAYIDYVQQAADAGFDLSQSAEGCLVLPQSLEARLVAYDVQTKENIFNAGTYDCGVCLDPKKGTSCYRMTRCGHVFCRQCLQDFYNNAIKEGDVSGVRCMDPTCGEEKKMNSPGKKPRRSKRTLSARELLAMDVKVDVVRRYVEMKRKKKLEADKSTVYCPRTWCQGPAKSKKYPPIPANLATYTVEEDSSDDEVCESSQVNGTAQNRVPPDPTERLAVCENCSYAFCRVCYMGWHGPFARCFPRDPNELSAEEKASYDYIRMHTSPCPYCNAPVQKTMGCNHMRCFQCNTHFCYLCGSWLDGNSPYQHFNKQGTPCFQRLWELEEGDEGQAPGDGQGFGGGRGWEQMAIEVAREAEAAEAEEAAARAQVEELDQRPQPHVGVPDPPVEELQAMIARAQAQLHGIQQHPQVGNLAEAFEAFGLNPWPQRAGGAANAFRRPPHPFFRGPLPADRRPVARPVAGRNEQENQQQAELQRFLELAQRDEEDGWDSDELGEDDEGFIIR